MSNVEIKVFYAKGIRLHIANRSFREAMKLIWVSPAFTNYDPIKIVFQSTGKTLYADKQSFINFLNNKLSMEELIEATQCDEVYRNTKELKTDDESIIDCGSLWKATQKELVLIDDDNYVTSLLNNLLFEVSE